MGKKLKSAPTKRSMNLYFKPDRTTKPATVALYVLFVVVVLLGLSKVLVYDLWVKVDGARTALAAVESRLDGVMGELSNYSEVKEKYQRYSATDEERELIDRMKVLTLLDEAIGATGQLSSVAVNGQVVQVQFSQVTLAQTAEIVRRLEESPIVERTTVNTAATTEEDGDLVSASILIQLQKEGEGE